MSIGSISGNNGGIVILPADKVGPDTKIETGPFDSVIIIYSDEDSLPELFKVVSEQRRLDKEQKHKFGKESTNKYH